jgi:small subunit ribosomal protein S18
MRKQDSSFALHKITHIDYKDIELLRMFLTAHGQMVGKRRSALTAKQQRMFSTAVKRARFMGLLPYVSA